MDGFVYSQVKGFWSTDMDKLVAAINGWAELYKIEIINTSLSICPSHEGYKAFCALVTYNTRK